MSKEGTAIKSFSEVLSLELEERRKYFNENIDAMREEFTRKEIAGILSSFYDDLVYQNDKRRFQEKERVKVDAVKRRFWNMNKNRIEYAILSSLSEYGHFPDIKHLAAKTQLNESALTAHLDQLDGHDGFYTEMQKAKIGKSGVMAYLLQFFLKGDLKAGDLYLKYVDQWTDLAGRPRSGSDVCIRVKEAE